MFQVYDYIIYFQHLRPVKWLLFVTFTICGVQGDLSATPNGPPVDYDSVSLDNPLAEAYYYTPEGIFADPAFVAYR